uniref:Protein FAR1-RELATED SEQUENCE n=1 Tax=Setaria italica TaxID=4555 RepID=K3YQJ6_SETIT
MGSTSREPPPDPPAPPPARAGDTEARWSIASLQEAAGDYTPRLGREFDSELEAYEFYLNYAWKVGFTVRRECANKSRKSGEISSSKYVCSREGFKSMDKRTNRSKTPQPDTRTGCKACLTVRRNNDSTKYEVYGFEPKHNHPLVVPSCANPLQRKLVDIQSAQANNSSNVTSACEPESRNSVIGDNAVTSREWQRPLRTRRQREIEYGEAAALLNYLQDQSRAGPLFYHAVQLDAEDKIANIFWADVKMITDFSQFGDVVSFDIEFKACINYYEEERELFTSWEVMINKYSLHGNVWLQKVFEEKEKWAGPYMKWTFSAGMKNTQLNERLHSDVGDYLRTDVDITLFMKHLQKVVDDRRYTELEIEFSSKLKLPDFKIRAPILIQASEAYTDMIFQLFQEEYEEFQSAYIVSRDESGPCREYIVAILDKERKHKVYGNPSEQTVLCSCRKFETLGFLCSHALKILDTMDIKYLPHRYILKRWTKYARCLTSQVDDRKVQEDTTLEFSNRYQYLCPVFVRLVARASVCEESYRALEQCSVEMSKKVEGIIRKQTSIDASACEPDTVDIQISLSVSATDNESEHAMNYSSNKRSKKTKKKGHKDKSQTRSCIKKGLQNKKTLQLEQPAVQFFMLDTPTQTVQDSLRVISSLSFIIVVDLHYMSLVVEHCARIYDEKYPCVNPH